MIRRDDWPTLEDQAAARLPGSMGRMYVSVLYARLREHVSGPLREIVWGVT